LPKKTKKSPWRKKTKEAGIAFNGGETHPPEEVGKRGLAYRDTGRIMPVNHRGATPRTTHMNNK